MRPKIIFIFCFFLSSFYATNNHAVTLPSKQRTNDSSLYFGLESPYDLHQSSSNQQQKDDVWNREHPLLGIDEAEKPQYFTYPINQEMKERFEKSIRLYENIVGKGDSSILLSKSFSPEASLEYILSYKNLPTNQLQRILLYKADSYIEKYINHEVSAQHPSLELRTLIFVLPIIGMPGDPKLSIGSKMRLSDGQIDYLAGKKFGNWAAGYYSWAIGIPEDVLEKGANKVQRVQDYFYIGKKLWNISNCKSNCFSIGLDHELGKDDPAGIAQTQAGRHYAFKQEYRKFLTTGRFLTSPSLGGNSAIASSPRPFGAGRSQSSILEKYNSYRFTPREKPSADRSDTKGSDSSKYRDSLLQIPNSFSKHEPHVESRSENLQNKEKEANSSAKKSKDETRGNNDQYDSIIFGKP